MDSLQQAYPHVENDILQSTLMLVLGDVSSALDLLQPVFGKPRGVFTIERRLNQHISNSFAHRNPTDDDQGYRDMNLVGSTAMPHGQMSENRDRAVSNFDDEHVQGIYKSLQSLSPAITLDFVRDQIRNWPAPRPDNMAIAIVQRLLEPLVNMAGGPFAGTGNPESSAPRGSVECGCCFTEYLVQDTTFCSNRTSPHRFCLDCAKSYVEAEIENQKIFLKCIHQSGCSESFPESEVRQFLDCKMYERLEKLRTQYELRKAALDGLVYCPFCDFAAIMEDPTDRIFECQNPGCGERSCRYCRVRSHHPMSCEKYQAEKNLDARHAVEEAMAKAFIRVCNKCGQSFVKDEGCNKMRCSCGNMQCYLCSKNVEDYDHFSSETCPLYEDAAERIRRDVALAQEVAVNQILQVRKDVTAAELTVDKGLVHTRKENGNIENPQFQIPRVPQMDPHRRPLLRLPLFGRRRQERQMDPLRRPWLRVPLIGQEAREPQRRIDQRQREAEELRAQWDRERGERERQTQLYVERLERQRQERRQHGRQVNPAQRPLLRVPIVEQEYQGLQREPEELRAQWDRGRGETIRQTQLNLEGLERQRQERRQHGRQVNPAQRPLPSVPLVEQEYQGPQRRMDQRYSELEELRAQWDRERWEREREAQLYVERLERQRQERRRFAHFEKEIEREN